MRTYNAIHVNWYTKYYFVYRNVLAARQKVWVDNWISSSSSTFMD
jgi:hypothetical protein